MKKNVVLAAAVVAASVGLAASVPSAPVDADVAKIAELERKIDEIETSALKAGRVLGEADAHGEYVLSEDGRRAEALRREVREIYKRRPDLDKGSERALWDVVPLGKAGTLKLPTEFVNKPVFRKRPPFRPGLVLLGNGRKCSIFAPRGSKKLLALADEFAWHLSQMSGQDFAVTPFDGKEPPKAAPAVLFAEDENSPVDMSNIRGEASVVKRIGDTLLIAGRGSGASHSMTHVLEALGFRYIWPGASGKIIPRRSEIVLPADIDIEFTPKFRVRGVRDGGSMGERVRYSLRRLGFCPEVAYARHRKVLIDRPGNRGFWQWHGVNDTQDVAGYSDNPGAYVWGHYFGDYAKRYWKDHPEWFALQKDGTRDMSKVGERPTFCLSNRELAEETVRDLVEKFKKDPKKVALSACLPDGGPTAQCMCPECRRLDPVNAPPSRICGRPYVSRTDRAFTFANRLADGVSSILPGKKLTFYAYSDYEQPPVAVKPHPALIILNVSGEYTIGRAREHSHRTLAAWSSFGNEMFWRPNVLRAFNGVIPCDFSRFAFEDTELLKANNFVGTDFDCMDNVWAVKGLMFYMTAKALMNPMRLSYDDLLDDYCRAGFGSAADDVKAYFAYLAKVSDEVTRDNLDYRSSGGKYLEAFDLDGANRLLDRAEASAAGDAEALRRIRLLRVGLKYAGHERNVRAAVRGPQWLAVRKEYLRFVHDMYCDDDSLVAVSLACFGFYNAAIRPALNDREKNPPKGGAVERLSPSSDGRDRTGDVNAALDRLRLAGGGTLEFAPGEYRFAASSALPLSFGISNHDQSAAHPVLFPVWGMTNVTVKANGSRFVSDSPAVVWFAVINSGNVSFEGFSTDAARPAMTEARLVRAEGGRTVVSVDRTRYQYEIADGRIVMTAPGWRSPSSGLIVFDGERGGIVPGSGDIRYGGAAEALPDGNIAIGADLRKAASGSKPGDVVVLRPQRRPLPAFFVSDSSGVSLTDVVVHDAQGMALVAQHSENVSWKGTGPAESRRSGVFPSAGRVSSTHADATHFSNVKGLVAVENCLFEGMMDDAINVHSTCLRVESVSGREATCRYMHYQAVGFDVFRAGERARFLKGSTLERADSVRTVVSARRLAPNRVVLEFDAPPPDGFGEGDAVENADYQPEVVFRGNIVRNNRARGALFTTPRPVLVEDNRFERVSGSAVLLAGDASKWYESGACESVSVRGNVFSNCCASAKCHGYCGGVVSIWPSVERGSQVPYHRNVRVEGNSFHSFDVPLLYAVAASNVVFAGNTVRRNDEYPGWGKGWFDVDRCQSVQTEPPSCESTP